MNTHNASCREKFAEERKILDADELLKIKGWSVSSSHGNADQMFYYVRDRARNMMWEGDACCKWDARTQALRTVVSKKSLIVDDMMDTLKNEVLGPDRQIGSIVMNNIRKGLLNMTPYQMASVDILFHVLKIRPGSN